MRITDIREKTVSIASPMANAYIDFSKMTCSVVAVVTDVVRDGKPVIGYGFNSNGRYGQGALMRDRFIARVLEADPATLVDEANDNLDPFAIWQALMTNEKPGGHGERSVAVGTIDMAVWDAVAKIAGVPLYKLLADRYRGGVHDEKVWVYAAGGYYYPGKDHAKLQDEVRSYLDRGYNVVKMKIGGASLQEDLARIEAVIDVVGDGSRLAVDANGRFDLETSIAYAEALRPYKLFWYEEAGDPLDYALQAELAAHYDLPMATGENLFSHQDARNLLRYGGMRPDRDWLQFDCALSYGLVEYLRTLDVMKSMGWSSRRVVPHGGHQMSLNIAAGLHLGGNESYPDVFQPFGGFADEIDVIDGYVGLPDIPGVGYEAKSSLYELMKTLTD
ncbi:MULTISPECIES: mandelate racemase/muconate lactonizing enzyme family protein [unclassified Marinobacter]|uniref:mandelate racemase/muconate lactonizing enzyme family protein n=1 Tax=unclassified Marinobacter TaxID=83889 RepID=UPI00200F1138|nr:MULTISPECIES: mandelate racemase/muconate lactonizing enzyme family protein [unclassified Marinobacter]UQG56518.1 mandelate racemase/muconate lactonizing enzyme family protein [Marinobacter sp. M4C]UQG65322.1 mandelate racemase/muconate lactonizing enzyme family protein [Marinobacter sp. M2C]UQG69601.1 mandelate racemase/muconate lactonizing enzyme family protein [Marinobacter sp. M1C]